MAKASSDNSTSRRRFMTVAAAASAVSAGALAVAAMPPAAVQACTLKGRTPDPAFALIAQKRAADLAHIDAINAQDEIEGRSDYWSDEAVEARDNCGAACDLVNQLDWKLANTPPTTLAGIAAVLDLANEIEDDGGDWPDTDTIGPEGWHYQLRATMAAAVEALIKVQS